MLVRPLLMAQILSATTAWAQSAPALTRLEPGTCPKCTAALERLAILGSATDKELPPDHVRVVQLSDGGFALAPTGREEGQVLRYDRSGKFLGTIGRLGDGPGEYRAIQSMVLARGDSLSILGAGRITTISASSGRGRSEPLAVEPFFHLVLGDGRVIVNSSGMKDPMFALLSPTSAVLSRFGPPPPPLVLPRQGGRTIGDQNARWVAMAVSPDGDFWAASVYYGHRLQKLTATGAVRRDLQRKPAWFPSYGYADVEEKLYRLGELRAPRPTVVNGTAVTSGGHLLALARVADATWKPDPKTAAPPAPGREGPAAKHEPTGGIDRYVDSVLEVYRDADGAFLGSWRSDAVLGQMTPNGLIYVKGEDADGIVSYTVYRVKVTGAK